MLKSIPKGNVITKVTLLPKVNAGKGTFRGAYCSSLVTPSGFALEARCKRLKAALRANLKY